MKTILFSTDLSPHSNNALKYAVKLAQQTKSRLVIFHSSYTPENIPKEEYDKIVKETTLYRKEALETKTKEYYKSEGINLPENVLFDVLNEKSVVDNIIHAGEIHKAELIVVGTHGLSALKKIFVGSTTSGLIEHSKLPVLAIPENYSFKEVNKLVLASNINNLDLELKSIESFSKELNYSIEVLFIDAFEQEKEKEFDFNRVVKNLNKTNITFVCKAVKLNKSIPEHIVDYINKKPNSMLVMFPENKNFIEKLLIKSRTEEVALIINKPFLSIRN